MNIKLYTRHNEVPILRQHDSKVEANYYNHVQVALNRLGQQIRFSIPHLKQLDLILQKGAWIAVDRILNGDPIVTWTDFKVKHRDSLHEPIKYYIRYFHVATTMIKVQTLQAMELLPGEKLTDKITNNEHEETTIISFRGNEQ